MGRLNRLVHPIPLKNKWASLRNLSLPENRPPKPFLTVNDRFITLNHNFVALRNLFLIPWFLGISYALYWIIDDTLEGWRGEERSAIRYIESSKKMYGDDFFNTTNDPIPLRKFQRINKDGEMSFSKYLDEIYNHSVGGKRRLIVDISYSIFFLIGIPGLLYWIIRFPRRAPLYFDRETRLVTTWRGGYSWVQRFDNLRILESPQGLIFSLRGEQKNGDLGWVKFVVQPSGNPLYSNASSYPLILAYLVQFMEFGKEHVLHTEKSFKRRNHFYLFEDKKPQNFDKKIQELLERIEKANDEPPLDENGIPIDNPR